LTFIYIINKMNETENITMNLEPEVTTDSADKVSQSKIESKNVSVKLLSNIKSILEITTARGSFKANELTSVGLVYDKLLKLLQ